MGLHTEKSPQASWLCSSAGLFLQGGGYPAPPLWGAACSNRGTKQANGHAPPRISQCDTIRVTHGYLWYP